MCGDIRPTEEEITAFSSAFQNDNDLNLIQLMQILLRFEDLYMAAPGILDLVQERVIYSYPEGFSMFECTIDHEDISGKFTYFTGFTRLVMDVYPSGKTTDEKMHVFADMYVHGDSVEKLNQYLKKH